MLRLALKMESVLTNPAPMAVFCKECPLPPSAKCFSSGRSKKSDRGGPGGEGAKWWMDAVLVDAVEMLAPDQPLVLSVMIHGSS